MRSQVTKLLALLTLLLAVPASRAEGTETDGGGVTRSLTSPANSPYEEGIRWEYGWTPSVTEIASDTSPTQYLKLSNEPERPAAGWLETTKMKLRRFWPRRVRGPDL